MADTPHNMKTRFLLYCSLIGLSALMIAYAPALDVGQTAYPTSEDTKIHKDMDNDSDEIGSLGNKPCKVLEVSGKWAKVQSGSGVVGWVYTSNLSDSAGQEQVVGITQSSNPDVVNAGRGAITDLASKYGAQQDKAETVDQLNWMLKFNRSVSADDVRQYDNENHLGH